MAKYLEFKDAKCKNCYKCLRTCPVKAIRFIDNQAEIIEERCILCGKCTNICPQSAKKVISQKDIIKDMLRNNKVVASVAPSFASNFDIDNFEVLRKALIKLGFYDAEETAIRC